MPVVLPRLGLGAPSEENFVLQPSAPETKICLRRRAEGEGCSQTRQDLVQYPCTGTHWRLPSWKNLHLPSPCSVVCMTLPGCSRTRNVTSSSPQIVSGAALASSLWQRCCSSWCCWTPLLTRPSRPSGSMGCRTSIAPTSTSCPAMNALWP